MTKENEEQNEQQEQAFRVTDKRSFRENGQPVSTEASDKAEDRSPDEKPPVIGEEKSSEEAKSARPPIDFPSYILSYYTQGLVLMGEVPNPYTNKKEEDIEAARHMIDILSMLEEKTKGNLSKDEQQLLESVLYELRMKFMAKTSSIKI